MTAHIFYSTRTRRDYARRHGRRLSPAAFVLVLLLLLLSVGLALRLAFGA